MWFTIGFVCGIIVAAFAGFVFACYAANQSGPRF